MYPGNLRSALPLTLLANECSIRIFIKIYRLFDSFAPPTLLILEIQKILIM